MFICSIPRINLNRHKSEANIKKSTKSFTNEIPSQARNIRRKPGFISFWIHGPSFVAYRESKFKNELKEKILNRNWKGTLLISTYLCVLLFCFADMKAKANKFSPLTVRIFSLVSLRFLWMNGAFSIFVFSLVFRGSSRHSNADWCVCHTSCHTLSQLKGGQICAYTHTSYPSSWRIFASAEYTFIR